MLTGTAPAIAYLFLGVFTLTTYLLGGIAREQVCIYMCPWPRIQGAMIDHETLLVSYRTHRGEPRGAHKKGQPWEGRGDCIDCKACVAVCPTGIDIRDGSQLECIQCALCIDACNDIMDKIGRPRALIAYDTIAGQEAAAKGGTAPLRILRARTLLYAGLISLVGVVMLVALLNRTTLEVNVLHDRNPPYVLLSDGSVRNGYTVKILNKLHEPREFSLEVRGLAQARLAIVGMDTGAAIRVATDDLRELRVLVTVPVAGLAKLESTGASFALVVRDLASGQETARTTQFQKPAVPSRGSRHEPDRPARRTKTARPARWSRAGGAFLGFFATIFVVNGTMIYSAVSTYSGLVANEPYRKGLQYNERIAAEERQARLGWKDALEIDRDGRVRMTLADADGRPVRGMNIAGVLGRPSTNRHDIVFQLVETSPGQYQALTSPLPEGNWLLSLEVRVHETADPVYRTRRRMWLKP